MSATLRWDTLKRKPQLLQQFPYLEVLYRDEYLLKIHVEKLPDPIDGEGNKLKRCQACKSTYQVAPMTGPKIGLLMLCRKCRKEYEHLKNRADRLNKR